MQYYPLFLNLKGRPVVVIGGGAVAERKIATLLKAGAAVTMIGPTLTPRLARWEAAGRIIVFRRPYRRGDLKGALLAFTATNESRVNEAVAREARQKRIPFNQADRAASDGFIVPAVFSKGGMTIAVSSGGKSPALAKQIRDYLKERWRAEDRRWVEIHSQIKRALVEKKLPLEKRRALLNRLAESELPALYRRGQIQAAHRLLLKLSGLRPADLAPPSNGLENGAAPRQKGIR
ncbi:MAG: bifunctional precorrin-2 dehydrogenase/sirohydrochlorin ferrochelatase [Candidatus Manganitrophaceae bacterium]|nr:MAG: bifunctional precorrin-2 dehydrogenase/sirohydrochlorin ferrochelatase [Candidatus Manganitrophaceae bacterium]